MKSEKMDRRVKYTMALLRESLIRLMRTHPVSKISVKMLCEDADVNRSTFYAHFNSTYDLLRWIERGLIRDFKAYITENISTDQSESAITILKQLLDYTADNADLFQVLLSEGGDTEFQQDLISILEEQMIPNFRNDKLNERTAKYLQSFIIVGALKILQKWLQDGRVESSQDMAEFITRILFQGVACYF